MKEQIQTFANVWDALEETAKASAQMTRRSEMMIAVDGHIKKNGWTQAEAAKRIGITQKRMSDLTRGRIQCFSFDQLVAMMKSARLRVDL